MISVSQALASSYAQKGTNKFINLVFVFFFNYQKSFDVQLPSLFLQNSYIPWLHLYLSAAVLQSYLRACLLGFSPQYVCRIKHKHSTFWLCVLFISVNTSLHFLQILEQIGRIQSFVILPSLSETLSKSQMSYLHVTVASRLHLTPLASLLP